ncbi:MAG: ROK family protein [Bacteroidales bacterium]|nr:ROK family protein [Bacteroidales bacterium]
MTQAVLAIDLGGTSADFAFIDVDGDIIYKENIPSKEFDTANSFVLLVKSLSKKAISRKKLDINIRAIGIGAPNGNYYRGTIEFAPNLRWQGIIPLADYFKMAFGGIPCFLTNDANAAAIGESMFGNAQNVKDFIMITLGTGVGSGIVINDELIYGNDGFAGELGHVIVKDNGRKCGCGRDGCLETYASVSGIKRTVIKLLVDGKFESELKGTDYKELSGKMIEQAALNGDKLAIEAFNYTGDILGKALANFVAFSSPNLIVLFGGLAQAGDLILAPTKTAMENNLLKIYQGKVPIIMSGLKGNNAAILGAAALAWKEMGVKNGGNGIRK